MKVHPHNHRSARLQPISRWRQHGFTLIELIMVIVVVGAMAVFAAPRLLDLSAWKLRAFADEVQSTTSAMQRLALAQRKPVVATFSTLGVTYAYVAGTALASVTCPAAVPTCMDAASVGTATFNSTNSGGTVASITPLVISVIDAASVPQYRFSLENDTGLVRRLP
jgi:prepilin-type N-terminal cleavage/methylation domain-containing protein